MVAKFPILVPYRANKTNKANKTNMANKTNKAKKTYVANKTNMVNRGKSIKANEQSRLHLPKNRATSIFITN